MASQDWLTAGARRAFAATMLVLAAYLSACPVSADERAMVLPVDPTPLVAMTRQGERRFAIEIADEPSERQAGLMFREQMADDHGMLFVFESTQPVGFWMKNTILPLDLIFIGPDGRVKAVRQGEPQSEAVISPGEPVRFVLEVKAGIAAREGIADGDLVRHPAIGTSPAGETPKVGDGAQPETGK